MLPPGAVLPVVQFGLKASRSILDPGAGPWNAGLPDPQQAGENCKGRRETGFPDMV